MALRRLNTIRRIEETLADIYLNQIDDEGMQNLEDTCVKNILSQEGEQLLTDLTYEEGKFDFDICPILNSKFEKDQLVTKLPCGHIFDKESIYNWLKNEKAECPVCRKQLPSEELSVSTKNDEVNVEELRENELVNNLAYNNDLHLLRTAFRLAFENLNNDDLNSSLNIIYNNMND